LAKNSWKFATKCRLTNEIRLTQANQQSQTETNQSIFKE